MQSYGASVVGGDRVILISGGLPDSPSRAGFVQDAGEGMLYRLKEDASEWEAFSLAENVAFSASVIHEGRMIQVGGIGSGAALDQVAALEIIEDGSVRTEILPALPEPLAMAAAAVHDGKLVVVGGVHSLDPLILNEQVFELSLAELELGWTQRDSQFPPRILPAAVTHLNRLVVAGGWTPDSAGEGWHARSDIWSFRTEGSQSTDPWAALMEAPEPLGDVSLFSVGQSHLMGVNIPVESTVERLEAIFSEDRENHHIVKSYHIITDEWYNFDQAEGIENKTAATNWKVTERTGFKTISKQVPVVLSWLPDGERIEATELWFDAAKGRVGFLDYLVVGFYLAVMIYLGLYYAKKEKNSADYFVGGRNVPWWAAAISAQATGASAITMMAIPALVYMESLRYVGYILLGIIPVIINAIFFIPILRRLNLFSVYEYLEKRFGIVVRLCGALAFMTTQIVGRMGVVVMLPAMALSAVTGINVYACIVVAGLVSMIYTTLGGISSVIWSDVIQFAIMLGGAILCIFLVIARVDGGFGTFLDVSSTYNKWQLFEFSFDLTQPVFYLLLIFAPAISFQTLSDQPFVQRISAVKDVKSAQKATLWNFLWAVPVQIAMWVVGIALFVFFKDYPGKLDPTLATDTVFPQFIAGQLPAGIMGLLIVGIIAAAMSTLDSSMNSVATVFVTDFYKRFKKSATERQCLRLARIITVLSGVLGIGSAILITTMNLVSAQETFVRILALFLGGFPALFALGLLSRRTNSIGGFAALFGSVGLVYWLQTYTSVHWVLFQGSAFVFALTFGYIVGWLTGGTRKDLTGLTVWDLNMHKGNTGNADSGS